LKVVALKKLLKRKLLGAKAMASPAGIKKDVKTMMSKGLLGSSKKSKKKALKRLAIRAGAAGGTAGIGAGLLASRNKK